MKPLSLVVLVAGALLVLVPARADEGGYRPMFNGKDLTGWVNVNCAPSTFFVKDGEIITTGRPTGYLRTAKQYENFIAEFDWMHVNKKEIGNSGFFVWADGLPALSTGYTRGIEVQVLVNLTYKNRKGEITATSQGDLFSIWGAHCKPDRPHPDGTERCLPSENRTKGGGEWNHYKVIGNNGVLKLHVNGKEVSGLSECRPRKGYLALESEGAECHFKNLKIKELPSTNPAPEEIADAAKGYRSLFTGLDLSGWKGEDAASHWRADDGVLRYDGKGAPLSTERQFGDAEFVIDINFLNNKPCIILLREGGKEARITATPRTPFKSGKWGRLHVKLKDNDLGVSVIGGGIGEARSSVSDASGTGALVLRPEGPIAFRTIFVRETRRQKISP
jgi:hypothetical protein